MYFKRYRRSTVREALEAVRLDLGPDALVLSTRVVEASGVRRLIGAREIEITAVAERDAGSLGRPGRPADRPSTSQTSGVAARLEAVGMEPGLAREIAETLPASRRRGCDAQAVKKALAARLAPLAAGRESHAPIEVFIGPPGVGKTTTIAKIAAQERARQGKTLGLVSADGFRVGAVEQLRLYADIIGSPFSVARSPRELERALTSTRRPVLLDTAGRSPSDDASREMLATLSNLNGVRTHLVLSAATTPNEAKRVFARFGEARVDRLVLTRLDEAESVAGLLGVLRDRQVPVSYLGTGQRVPDDLQPCTPEAFADWIVGDEGRQGAVA